MESAPLSDPTDELAAAALIFAQAIIRASRIRSEPALISIDDAAARLGVSRGTVRNLIARGELDDAHVGRRRLIVAASLERLVERRR